ncbi:hypothetical protein ACLEPN_42280, partial [Myxococcus sp. 1LA]
MPASQAVLCAALAAGVLLGSVPAQARFGKRESSSQQGSSRQASQTSQSQTSRGGGSSEHPASALGQPRGNRRTHPASAIGRERPPR